MSTFARKIENIKNMKQLFLTIITFLMPLLANANHVSTVDANYNLDDPEQEQTYKLTYMVDGTEYKSSDVIVGTPITPEPAPTKEGYTFSGWSEIPELMPDHDVTVTGTFSINTYTLTYKVDGAVYKTSNIEYGATITPEPAPTKEGYTFSGWSEIPETMPAHDFEVTGTFSINTYTLTYKVDGEVYKEYPIEYGKEITPEAEPTKEGYKFSGWSEIPATMPAHHVEVTGTFTLLDKYKLTYIVDGQEYKSYDLAVGDPITPEAEPTKEGHTFSGWKGLPESLTMPAEDVTVTGAFAYKLTYMLDGEVYGDVEEIEYGTSITCRADPEAREGYTFSGWQGFPETNTMPAEDVTVTGTFTLLDKYKLTYIVDGQEYKSYDLAVGDPITPEAEPTKEGHTFSGWQGLPESLTMPAEDVTVTGAFAYKLTYMLDGEVYKEDPEVYYGTEISLEADPEAREGYTFSGWQGFPETNTMPAEDVTVTGTFTLIQKYKLTYILDGVEYKTFELESGESITPEPDPTNDEGRKFSGWQGLPESLTMPAEDVTVTGAFAYKLTYKVDGEVYKEDPEIYYGTEITPEAEPTKKGYTFSGWSEIPATMPAHDVTVIGTFTINEDELKFTVDGICYAIGENHNVSVISKEGNYSGKVVIPSKVSHKETTYNVTGIGANAFENCSGLTSVTIPSSVTKIDKDAFKDCRGLTSVHISDLAAWCNIDFVESSGSGVPFSSNPLNYAHHLYLNGSEIKSLEIPQSVKTIKYAAFEGCSGLTSVTIPNNVTSIGRMAFRGCSGFASLTIPKSVTYIGAYAFWECSGLTSIESEITSPFAITNVFESSITNSVTLYIPIGTKSAYQSTSGWKSFKKMMERGGIGFEFEADGINYRVSENNTVFVVAKTPVYSGKVVIPEKTSYSETTYNVNGIGASAFEGCTGLTSVTIPSSVTKIDKDAFKDCSGLKSVNISDLAAWCNIDFVKGSVVENAGSNSNQNPSTDPSTSEEVININVRITNNRSSSVTLDGDLQFVFANPDKNGNYHGTNDDGSPYTGTYNRSGHLRFSTSPVTIQAGQSMTFAMNNVEIGGRNPLEPSKITWTIDKRAPRNVMLYVDGNSSTVLADNMDPNIVFVNGGTYDIVIPNSNSSTRSVTTSETDNVETSTRAATGDVTTTVTIVNNSGASKTFDGRVCFITYGTYVGYTGYFRMKGTCSGASLTIPAGGSQTYTVLFAKDNNQTPSVAAGMHFASQAQRGQFQSNNGYYINGNCYTCNDFSTNDTFRDGGIYTMTIPANTHEWSSSSNQDNPGGTIENIPVNISSNPLYYAHHLYLNGTEITSLEIPQSIKAIKYATFEGCSGITSLTIHNSVNSIGEQAFHGCSGITTLALPESVKSIGSYAFSGCRLTVINSDILSPSAIPNAFDSNVCGSATLYIHAGTLSAYQSKDGWKDFANIIEVDDIIEGVEINGIYYDINLTKVKVIVTKATSSGFYKGEIIIPEQVTYDGKTYRVAEIGASAFEGCTGITSVTIPNNVVVINDGAFYGCTSLENVILPEELVIIGQGAFSGCYQRLWIRL